MGYEHNPPSPRVTYDIAAHVRTEKVDWLLDCWIPKGAVSLLSGREGIGKSTIAVDWAAQASTGKLTGRPQNVAYVVSEDSKEHTVVPRLKAAGADLRRVMFPEVEFPDPDTGDIYRRTLDLPGDTSLLEQFIIDRHVGLVILDAAKSVMSSKLKGNDDMDIRRFLEPLARIAEATGTTFVCLVHLSAKKASADTGNLIMGSSAWSQVARSVVTVAADKDAGTVKVWNSKANLAPRIRTMEAQVVSATVATDDDQDTEVGRIQWIGECDTDGTDLLNPDAEHDAEDADEVKMILFDYLESQGGEAPAGDCLKACRAAGLSDQTVKNRRRKLGVESRRRGRNEWVWSISRDTDRAEVLAASGDTGTSVPRYLHRSEGVTEIPDESRYRDTEIPDTQEPGTSVPQRAALSIITGDQE
ncbi:MAG: AAA family ATPase [Corynebacterium variabile]|uniref:AAA family ATPase n=1 Tax=Corynebacterium variabile TaxID=1727 RepID=UPI003F8F4616